MKTITQYAKIYSDPPEKIRNAGRALIVKEDKILLTYETNTDVYMSPGGGLEENETLEECCIREVCEESGYKIKVIEPFIKINEYSFETLYISNYFICEIIGNCEQHLTDIEVEHGAKPEWVKLDTALEVFGEYSSKREDVMSLYLREYTVLNEYLKNYCNQ